MKSFCLLTARSSRVAANVRSCSVLLREQEAKPRLKKANIRTWRVSDNELISRYYTADTQYLTLVRLLVELADRPDIALDVPGASALLHRTLRVELPKIAHRWHCSGIH